jgi:hypothetical protein
VVAVLAPLAIFQHWFFFPKTSEAVHAVIRSFSSQKRLIGILCMF